MIARDQHGQLPSGGWGECLNLLRKYASKGCLPEPFDFVARIFEARHVVCCVARPAAVVTVTRISTAIQVRHQYVARLFRSGLHLVAHLTECTRHRAYGSAECGCASTG